MSLEIAAQHLASRGRGPDTMLVHMAPQEVAGLQALAKAGGGSLTVNPETGLAEAGFLKNLLPMIIGAGLVAATGGAAAPGLFGLSNAATIGLGIGGLETARTGSLSKGLKAGLGAYGGAGLAGGLSSMGASQAADAASGALMTPAGAVTTGAGTAAELGSMEANAAIQAAREQAIAKAVESPFQTMGQGLGAALKNPSQLATAVGGGKDLIKLGAAAAVPAMMAPPEQGPQYTGSGANPYQYTYSPNAQEYQSTSGIPMAEQRYFRPAYTRMAEGGPVEQMSMMNSPYVQGIENGGNVAGYANGGMSHLGDYSDGGRLLKGPGDGVSDSIPATIADKQPARLADGEFVVPARIVSELGNGSTDAGARKLYAMMDRIQKNRAKSVGKGKVAVNSRSEKLLPA
jgi:hypothetical protein